MKLNYNSYFSSKYFEFPIFKSYINRKKKKQNSTLIIFSQILPAICVY